MLTGERQSRECDSAIQKLQAEALAWLEKLSAQVKDAASQETLLNVKAEVMLSLGRRAEATQTLEQQVESRLVKRLHVRLRTTEARRHENWLLANDRLHLAVLALPWRQTVRCRCGR